MYSQITTNTAQQNTNGRVYAICGCRSKNCTIHETKKQASFNNYQLNQAITNSLKSFENEKHTHPNYHPPNQNASIESNASGLTNE